jgi:hypothetical protein
MHNYEAMHGRLPPAVVYGKDGKPLLSWRVLLLPFIEEDKLFEEFHLDEPWDGPHNIQLLPRMPRNYAAPSPKAKKVPPYHTFCKVFVGKGAAFEGREGLRLSADFPDGVSNTLLVVEAGEPVPWTKPDDLPFDPDGPLPDLRGLFERGFRACTADCHRHDVLKGVPERTLRAAITRNGGEELGADW